jgi:iron(III) transport system ATP-binding protein
VSDRVALMRAGRIVQVGTPEDVWRQPVDLAAARFFSEINVVEARVSGGAAATAFGTLPTPSLADGAMILVAFRPQSLYLATDGSGVEARVESVGFVGDAYQLHLRVAGIDEPMSMRTAMDARPQPGERLRIAVNHGEALLFAAA